MNKIALLIMITLAALHFTGCGKGGQSVVANDGLVNFVTGNAEIISDGKSITPNVGDKITQGMTVKTGPKAIVEIGFKGSIIRIKEKSSILMKELITNSAGDKDRTELFVDNGEVLFKVTKKLTDDEKFRVNTPTSVAGVRGTEFIVNADEKKSVIGCMEGKVAVKESSSDDSSFVIIGPGEEAVVEKGKPVLVKNINEDTGEKNKKNPEQKKTESKEIKGGAMIRAEAVKGDIDVKK